MIYRTSLTDPSRQATFTLGALAHLLATPDGQTIYAFTQSPRENGIFTLDLSTGAATRLPWNLDLIELGALIATATYVDR